MVLVDPDGAATPLCLRCLEKGEWQWMGLGIPCANKGCWKTPVYLVEHRDDLMGPVVLCEGHFTRYLGGIRNVFLLPDCRGEKEDVLKFLQRHQ